MKNFYLWFLTFFAFTAAFAQNQTVNYTVNPPTFNENETITITFTNVNEAAFGVSTTHALYLWAWSIDNATNQTQDCPTNGTWTNSNEANRLTYVSPGTYTFTMIPATFYARTDLKTIGLLIKNKTGSVQTGDILIPVGRFQMTLTNPAAGSTTVVASGSVQNITATSSLPANWQLKNNGAVIYTSPSATASFSYPFTVTGDSNMEIIATDAADPSETQSRTFTYIVTPTVQTAPMPAYMRQGINYDPADPTKVGLAIYAPYKNYVHVIGSFNNWNVNSNYLMKRSSADANTYWIEITGLTPQQVYTFQYRTNDGVKVADPYSTLVLSPDDDPWISASIYPNMPVYPAGQQYDVSVVQTAMPAYNWTVTNFAKPAKENLIVYEALIRDFTIEKTWQSMIDKIPYFKGLNVNAIELMPVMEFDGNNSWGYNPSFHMALDKAYGTADKMKEFVDKCHQNGIAVILDVALNHATGRNPLERLWSTSTNGGYGDVSAINPFFNQIPRHSYNVYYDFNHSRAATKYYVNRVLEQWIKEFKIDGFRWDLTKGFTQACSPSDEGCTGSYQQDRVDILKTYADYQWSHDPTSYIIFEHLGQDNEEQQWANYRIGEGKGVMMWDNLVYQYGRNTMANADGSNFNRVDFENHGFAERRNISYSESHDEERLMYKNIYDPNSNSRDLNTGLNRQKAIAAVQLAVPGPKMIWQFGELGYQFSINTCENGTISDQCRTAPKPVAFDLGYDTVPERKAIYDTWSKVLGIRLNNEVFNTNTFTVESGDLMPRIYIWKNGGTSPLNYVVIVANFTLNTQNITPWFPYTGTWYNLMDNSPLAVSSTSQTVAIEPGGFRIFGNSTALYAATDDVQTVKNEVSLIIAQNPVTNGIAKLRYTNANNGVLAIYDISGKMVQTAKTSKVNGDENISISGLKSGVYIVQLKSDKGIATAKMIVK